MPCFSSAAASVAPRIIAPMFSAAVDSKRSAPRPAQSPTLSPTRSAMTAGLRGSSSGNAGLDLADEVGADVGRLGVDAAAELGEERHERGAEAVPDDQEGNLGRRDLGEPADQPVEAPDAEERHRHDEEARNGAAPQGRPEGVVQGGAGGRGRPDVGPDRDPHPDVAGDDRAGRAEDERQRRPEGEPHGGRDRVEVVVVADEAVEEEDHRRQDQGENPDRRVLAPQEGLGPLLDGVGDRLHGGRAGVALQDPGHQIAGDEERSDGEDHDQGQGKLVRHSSNSCFRVNSRPLANPGGRRGRISEGARDEGRGPEGPRGQGLRGRRPGPGSLYWPTGTASMTMPMFLAPALRHRSITLMTSP